MPVRRATKKLLRDILYLMPDLSRDVEPSAMSLHLLVIGGTYAACLAARAQGRDPLGVSVTSGG